MIRLNLSLNVYYESLLKGCQIVYFYTQIYYQEVEDVEAIFP